MTTSPGLRQLMGTKMPLYNHEDSSVYLRRWLLDLELRVQRNEVVKHQMLRDALHKHVMEQFGVALDSLVQVAADQLYERLTTKGCEIPDDFEADTPDGDLPLDLPGPDSE